MISKLDDALRFFGLRKSDLRNHDKVQEVMQKRLLAAHPDRSLSSGENIQQILEARNIIKTHMQYYKPLSLSAEKSRNVYIDGVFVPSKDARASLIEMIEEAVMQNMYMVESTIYAIVNSGHLAEAVNTPDKNNDTPLHVAARKAAITQSSAALFYELMIIVEDAFDYTATNNRKQTLLDVIDYYGRGDYGLRATFFEKIETRTKEAMTNKALKLIEETVKDNKALPKAFLAMKEKFQAPAFQSLSGEEKLAICKDIIRERNTHYEGYLGLVYSFFSNRHPETSAMYQTILDFDPLNTKTMIELESAVTSSTLAWKGLQIAYKEGLYLKDSPEHSDNEEKSDSEESNRFTH